MPAADGVLRVTSPAYVEGAAIPSRHTCHGADVSPPFLVAGIPRGATHIAWVLDDPDAPRGTWTHWTAWDVPVRGGTLEVPEAVAVAALGGREGTTTARTVGYHGPCPPSGTHRYRLHVHALRAPAGLAAGAGVAEAWAAIRAQGIAAGLLTGTFTRPSV